MATLWPWLAVAGLGALHGASPAGGWQFAAAQGMRAHDATQARRALVPIAIGHVASIAIVAWVVARGMAIDRPLFQWLAGALLVGAASLRFLQGAAPREAIGPHVGNAGIALWSFLMATAQGAGLMLVPALVPLCLAGGPVRATTASGSMVAAIAAVAVHTAAMLVTTGVIATGVCHGIARHPRLRDGAASRRLQAVALVATGVWLMTMG